MFYEVFVWFAYHAVLWGNQQTWSRLIWRGIYCITSSFKCTMTMSNFQHYNVRMWLMILNCSFNLMFGHVHFFTFWPMLGDVYFWGESGDLMDWYQSCFLVNQFLVKDEVKRWIEFNMRSSVGQQLITAGMYCIVGPLACSFALMVLLCIALSLCLWFTSFIPSCFMGHPCVQLSILEFCVTGARRRWPMRGCHGCLLSLYFAHTCLLIANWRPPSMWNIAFHQVNQLLTCLNTLIFFFLQGV